MNMATGPFAAIQDRAVKVLYVTLFAVGMGLLLPGSMAKLTDTFYDEDVRDKLPEKVAKDLRDYEEKKINLEKSIKRVDDELLRASTTATEKHDIDSLIKLRVHLAGLLANMKSPFFLVGFYLSRIMLLWPAFYFSVGFLAFVIPPRTFKRSEFNRHWKSILVAFALLFPIYRFPTWIRNFVTQGHGQIVYSDSNYSVSGVGFFTQELMAAANCFLIVIIWMQWSSYYKERKNLLLNERFYSGLTAIEPDFIELVSNEFFRWQISSVVLAFGFIWYTQFFWFYVVHVGDARYLLHAIVIHGIWAFSWTLITLPLAAVLARWQNLRAKLIWEATSHKLPNNLQLELFMEAIQQSHPIGSWNLTITSIAAILSFSLPVLDAVAKYIK